LASASRERAEENAGKAASREIHIRVVHFELPGRIALHGPNMDCSPISRHRRTNADGAGLRPQARKVWLYVHSVSSYELMLFPFFQKLVEEESGDMAAEVTKTHQAIK